MAGGQDTHIADSSKNGRTVLLHRGWIHPHMILPPHGQVPFNGKEEVFKSDIVREEYEKLCRDHNALIRMGEGYGSFDPLGKVGCRRFDI